MTFYHQQGVSNSHDVYVLCNKNIYLSLHANPLALSRPDQQSPGSPNS